ncbi:MAG TPA: diaminopimelate epimerase [Bryobacteraceae bacterium]|jgi:diaminopimelate epimerase|nr:diaminopimelate epimerase [Bryobacteraceae bacterium]
MKIPFSKLHGAKNDFLLTMAADAPLADLPEIARAICNRYTGVGADGWMIVEPTPGIDRGENYDATIRLFNSDGSEPELSGNGTRCAALLLRSRYLDEIRIRTGAGIKHLRLVSIEDDREFFFEMNMGKVRVVELAARVQDFDAVIVDVGNPQCALPVANFDFDWRTLGAAIENDARFPNRTNVSFIRSIDRHSIDVRFWERGAGETNSSGTGSTGAALAALARGFAESPVNVHTPAGPLIVRSEVRSDGATWLTGPAEYIADGVFRYGRMGADD